MEIFLFVMVMSVIMHDTVADLEPDDKASPSQDRLATVLYADDTLLIGPTKKSLNRLLSLVASKGRAYGLELHWDKFQVLNIRSDFTFTAPSGDTMPDNGSMIYLGASLSSDGKL